MPTPKEPRKIRTEEGQRKHLPDCTRAEIEALARNAKPSTASRGVTKAGNYRLLADEMTASGAETVSDLGQEKLLRYEQLFKLHFASAADILLRNPSAFKLSKSGSDAAPEHTEPEAGEEPSDQ